MLVISSLQICFFINTSFVFSSGSIVWLCFISRKHSCKKTNLFQHFRKMQPPHGLLLRLSFTTLCVLFESSSYPLSCFHLSHIFLSAHLPLPSPFPQRSLCPSCFAGLPCSGPTYHTAGFRLSFSLLHTRTQWKKSLLN